MRCAGRQTTAHGFSAWNVGPQFAGLIIRSTDRARPDFRPYQKNTKRMRYVFFFNATFVVLTLRPALTFQQRTNTAETRSPACSCHWSRAAAADTRTTFRLRMPPATVFRPGLCRTHVRRTKLIHAKWQLIIMQSRADAHRLSFFPRTVTDWNSLPSSVILKPSMDFLRLIYTVYLASPVVITEPWHSSSNGCTPTAGLTEELKDSFKQTKMLSSSSLLLTTMNASPPQAEALSLIASNRKRPTKSCTLNLTLTLTQCFNIFFYCWRFNFTRGLPWVQCSTYTTDVSWITDPN